MKIYLYMIILILMAACVSASYTTIFVDSFGAEGLDTSQWLYNNQGLNASTQANITQINGHLESGGNVTSTSTWPYIQSYQGLNSTSSGKITITYQRGYGSTASNVGHWFCLNSKMPNTLNWCGLCFQDGNNDFIITRPVYGSSGNLRLATITENGDSNSHIISIEAIRQPSATYFIATFDGSPYAYNESWCSATALNTSIYHYSAVATDGIQVSYWWDFSFVATSYTLGQTGFTCITADDCLSGKCLFGTCVLKGWQESCENSGQCVSGQCIGDKCTKPTLWQTIDTAKSDWVGNDAPTNNLIAIFISLLFGAAFIFLAFYVKAEGLAPFIGGVAGFYVAMVFFTIVGWLSPFILIGLFVATGLIILVAVILGNRG